MLIISPYFPPSNAADMQRVRMSLPYFKQFGWESAVVTVDATYSEMVKDDLLNQSIPADCKIYTVKAFDKNITSKFGFGSLGFRAMLQYRARVSAILRSGKFDLIYFSTTQFPVCVLGPYWKSKFSVPYVIDMQDPWYSRFYDDKTEKPPKYRLVYGLHKIMEAKAMRQVDGLISVSQRYIDDLKTRYRELKNVPSSVITFGAFETDMAIANENQDKFPSMLDAAFINIVYIGRGGADMHRAITPVFKALKLGLDERPEVFGKLKLWFIGTSYAPAGQAVQTILPLANKLGVEKNVVEITGRVSYYQTFSIIQQADGLFIPGSEDPKYTASKIYPYLLTKKPLLAVFNKESSAVNVLRECTVGATIITFPGDERHSEKTIYRLLEKWADRNFAPLSLSAEFKKYDAKALTGKQTELFDRAVEHFKATA